MKLRMSAAGLAALFTLAVAAGALAQTPPAQPKAPAQPKQTTPAPKGPAAQNPPAQTMPAQAAQPQQQSQPAGSIATPWTKRCAEEPQTKKQLCEISQAQIAETGQFLMSASLAELPDNNQTKIFRVVAPIGMLIQPGIRVLIDGQALQSELPYTACVAPPNQSPVCLVEVQVEKNFIDALKKSQEMWVQVITAQAPPRTIHFIFPTKEFAKVFDGPAMDMKAMEDQRKKMQEKLQKAADEARVEREKQQKQ